MKLRALRIVRVVVLVEVAYLVLANLALNLPLTQTLLNQHRPEKYAVQWDRAWTWYPLQVQASGITASGQTSSQQWYAQVDSASLTLAAYPLLRRTVRISGAQVQDVDFRLRPRPRADRDDSAVRAFFPPIPGRDPDLPAVPRVPKPGSGWKVAVEGLRASGDHRLWIYQVRGEMSGELAAYPRYTFRGGPFSLAHGEADVALKSLTINGEPAVSSGGTMRGRFEVAPFVPSEHRGIKALGFLSVDAEVDAEVESLDFLDIYLRRFNAMDMDGKGTLQGRLHYHRGDLVNGTAMTVSASELILNVAPYRVAGTGDIRIGLAPEDPETLTIGILFGALSAFHRDANGLLFSGEKLGIEMWSDNSVLPDERRNNGHRRVAIRIPRVAVPDLSAYQYLLPTRWHARLNGGSGELAGEAEFSSTGLSAQLRLLSNDADVAFTDYRFVTSLDLGVKARAESPEAAHLDLSGSYLRLEDARLASDAVQASETWNASLNIRKGTLDMSGNGKTDRRQRFADLARTLRQRKVQDVLANMNAELEANLDVSDLGWLNLLFRNALDLSIAGAGEAQALLKMRSGWLAEGTTLKARPRALQVTVLDYVFEGEGSVALLVENGGETPDMALDAVLKDSRLRRRSEETSLVEQVELVLKARAEDVTLGDEPTVAAIDLRIPSARVTDMTLYNRYIPGSTPLRLSGGQAQLSADIHLERESAGGYVRLATEGLQSRLDDQLLSGELMLDINLAGGEPGNMAFDISGSSLRLDEFKVAGDELRFDQPGWAARFDLDRGQVLWKDPVRLDAEGRITMQDTRPIVALLANQRGKHGWIEKLLTTEDISGEARLEASDGRVLIPHAFVSSDKIDVGAKGLISGHGREGMFFARFRKLRGILKVKDDKRNFDIIGATKKFSAYVPGKTEVFAKSREIGSQDRE
ncbi:MAG: hypothetical protein HWE39_16955 [Oceanospirillaceae bacterium]|nr:hypothetical protein [Oceanospirillaceae bacterium]